MPFTRPLPPPLSSISRNRGFDPKQIQMRFLVYGKTLVQFLLSVHRFSAVCVTPPMLDTHLRINSAFMIRTSGPSTDTFKAVVFRISRSTGRRRTSALLSCFKSLRTKAAGWKSWKLKRESLSRNILEYKFRNVKSALLLLLLVFSPWAGLGRDQSSVRRLVWLWYAASWANS